MAIQVKTNDYISTHKIQPNGIKDWKFTTEDSSWAYYQRGHYQSAKLNAKRAYSKQFGTSYGILILCS